MDPLYSSESFPDSTRATTPESPGMIITSPYTTPEHLLDLSTLNAENALLAQVLQGLKCTREDYATAGYQESFNWEEVLDRLKSLADGAGGFKETSFFIVAFRSRVPPSTVYEDLGVLDEVAHREAVECGGFLK